MSSNEFKEAFRQIMLFAVESMGLMLIITAAYAIFLAIQMYGVNVFTVGIPATLIVATCKLNGREFLAAIKKCRS